MPKAASIAIMILLRRSSTLCEYTLVGVMNSKLINSSQSIYVRAYLPFLLHENIPQ